MLIALQKYEDSLCPGCGWPSDVCTDPRLHRAWSAKMIRRDAACRAINQAKAQRERHWGAVDGVDDDPASQRWIAVLAPEGLAYLDARDPGADGVD